MLLSPGKWEANRIQFLVFSLYIGNISKHFLSHNARHRLVLFYTYGKVKIWFSPFPLLIHPMTLYQRSCLPMLFSIFISVQPWCSTVSLNYFMIYICSLILVCWLKGEWYGFYNFNNLYSLSLPRKELPNVVVSMPLVLSPMFALYRCEAIPMHFRWHKIDCGDFPWTCACQ